MVNKKLHQEYNLLWVNSRKCRRDPKNKTNCDKIKGNIKKIREFINIDKSNHLTELNNLDYEESKFIDVVESSKPNTANFKIEMGCLSNIEKCPTVFKNKLRSKLEKKNKKYKDYKFKVERMINSLQ